MRNRLFNTVDDNVVTYSELWHAHTGAQENASLNAQEQGFEEWSDEWYAHYEGALSTFVDHNSELANELASILRNASKA